MYSLMPEHQQTGSFPTLHISGGPYRDLLDLPRVGDDLLHDLHGLPGPALRLLGLSLRLRLHDLHLLAFSHLHRHRGGLRSEQGVRAQQGPDTGQHDAKSDRQAAPETHRYLLVLKQRWRETRSCVILVIKVSEHLACSCTLIFRAAVKQEADFLILQIGTCAKKRHGDMPQVFKKMPASTGSN